MKKPSALSRALLLSLAASLPLAAQERAVQQPAGLALPTAVATAQLAQQLRTDPAKVVVLDIRPAWQFTDWAIPGTRSVKLEDLEAAVAAVPAEIQVVLVDRDGTQAFAAAGALMARKPGRMLHALVGGLTNWYREVELRSGPARGAMTPVAPPSATPTAAPKKRSAGC